MKTLSRHSAGESPAHRQVGDQQIIDALWSEPRVLPSSGLTWEAVRLRGEQLGMSPRFIRGCRLAGTRPTLRDCMNCEHRFLSAGSHNRLCGRCRRL